METRDPAVKRRILDYNDNDCRATRGAARVSGDSHKIVACDSHPLIVPRARISGARIQACIRKSAEVRYKVPELNKRDHLNRELSFPPTLVLWSRYHRCINTGRQRLA